jgi:hypothetical protein
MPVPDLGASLRAAASQPASHPTSASQPRNGRLKCAHAWPRSRSSERASGGPPRHDVAARRVITEARGQGVNPESGAVTRELAAPLCGAACRS